MSRWLAMTVMGMLVAILSGCGEEPRPQQTPVQPVKLATVSGGDQGMVRHYPGKVVATEGSQLAFRVSGQLVELPVRAGELVEKGQLLARLDPSDFQNQLADRQAQYDLADSQYQRGISLQQRGVISEAQFDQLKARRRQTHAALKQARDNVTYTRITAPFSGTVARTLVENHQFVQAKEPILYLQSNDNIDIEFAVPERFITNVHENSQHYQPEVRLEGAPDKVFKAHYKEHEASADTRTQTYTITLTMPNPDGIFVLPGMSVDITIDLSQIMRTSRSQPRLPVEAVFQIDGEGGTYVWRYHPDSHTVSRQAVTLGEVVDNGIEIVSGVSPGDRIVVAGVHHLEDGQQVRPLTKERGL